MALFSSRRFDRSLSHFHSASDLVSPLIPVFNSIYSVIPASFFGNLVFVSIFISRKSYAFLFSDCFWQPTFVFISVLSSCISRRTLFMFCFTMAPVFPTSAASLQLGHLGWSFSCVPWRADYLYVPVVPWSHLHLVSSCSRKPDSATKLPTTLTRAVACEVLQVGTLCLSSLICNLLLGASTYHLSLWEWSELMCLNT